MCYNFLGLIFGLVLFDRSTGSYSIWLRIADGGSALRFGQIPQLELYI